MRRNTDYTFNIVQTHKNRLDYFQVVSALTILKLKIIIGLFSTKNWYCFSLFYKFLHCCAFTGGYFHKVNAGGQGGNVNIYFVINITRHSETAFGGRGYLFRVGSPIIEIASDFALAITGTIKQIAAVAYAPSQWR